MVSFGVLLVLWLAGPPPATPIVEAHVVSVEPGVGRVTVRRGPDDAPAHPLLVLTAGVEPIAVCTLTNQQGEETVFGYTPGTASDIHTADCRAWLVGSDLVGQVFADWPMGASLNARIDRVGPGARSAWIRAGADEGIQVGDRWWLRAAGQPLARFDVRSVEQEACFCAAVALATDVRLAAGQVVELWPSPGQRRGARAISAVAYVESAGGEHGAWVAAPAHVDCPRDPHLSFYRDGRYVGHGIVEAMDDRFWYARVVTPKGDARDRAPPAAPQPTTDASPPEAITVGDEAVVRTSADIQQRRFVAHVFESSPEGVLVDAGEADGLTLGQTVLLTRDGMRLGKVRVERVQRGYSVVRCVDSWDGERPAPGDAMHVGPPPAEPVVVAEITAVTDKLLFAARLASEPPPPMLTPLAISSGGRTMGVAVLLAREGPLVCGLALEPSLSAPLRPGDRLLSGSAEHP